MVTEDVYASEILSAESMIRRLELAATRQETRVDGCKMCWRTWGNGNPVLLLHGGHGSWLHWIRNIEALATSHAVWVPDLPGFGDSDQMPGPPHAPDRQVRLIEILVASVAQLLGEHRLIDLVGFSFGGLVAAQLAVRRSHVGKLILLGPAATGSTRRQSIELVNWRTPDRTDRLSAIRQNLAALMLHRTDSLDAMAMTVHEVASMATRYRSKSFSRSLSLSDILTPYEGVLHVVWGEYDLTATPAQAICSLAQAHPDRHFHMISNAGHWVQFECPDEVNGKLAQILSS